MLEGWPFVPTSRRGRSASLPPTASPVCAFRPRRSEISETIGAWESFYVASTGAAAVLLGLVFVGLSVHFERRSDSTRIRPLATQSAVSLLYAVLISLVMLVPEGRPLSQAVILGVVSLFGLWTSTVATVGASRGGTGRLSLTFRYAVPFFAMVVLATASILLGLGHDAGVWLVGAVVFIHVVVGTQNAWDLFLGAGALTQTPTRGPGDARQ